MRPKSDAALGCLSGMISARTWVAVVSSAAVSPGQEDAEGPPRCCSWHSCVKHASACSAGNPHILAIAIVQSNR